MNRVAAERTNTKKKALTEEKISASKSELNEAVAALNCLEDVVHAPGRLIILRIMQQVESIDYLSLLELTKMTWGNLSCHLRKLNKGGLIEMKRTKKGNKPWTIILMTSKGKQALEDWKEKVKVAFKEFNAELSIPRNAEIEKLKEGIYIPRKVTFRNDLSLFAINSLLKYQYPSDPQLDEFIVLP